jgi:hypothetical protein
MEKMEDLTKILFNKILEEINEEIISTLMQIGK